MVKEENKEIHISVRLDNALSNDLDQLHLSRGAKSRLIRVLLRKFLDRASSLRNPSDFRTKNPSDPFENPLDLDKSNFERSEK